MPLWRFLRTTTSTNQPQVVTRQAVPGMARIWCLAASRRGDGPNGSKQTWPLDPALFFCCEKIRKLSELKHKLRRLRAFLMIPSKFGPQLPRFDATTNLPRRETPSVSLDSWGRNCAGGMVPHRQEERRLAKWCGALSQHRGLRVWPVVAVVGCTNCWWWVAYFGLSSGLKLPESAFCMPSRKTIRAQDYPYADKRWLYQVFPDIVSEAAKA